jgi:hypothetical protein
LGAYLALLSLHVGAVDGSLALLGVETRSRGVTVDELDALAHWLRDAKFLVQDPFRFQAVCEQLACVTDRQIETRAVEMLRRLRDMATAAVNNTDLSEFL